MSRSDWQSGLVALAFSAWLGVEAKAQGVVPGGWSSQFSYQTFVGPGVAGGGGYLGYGYGVPGAGFSPYGMGGFVPTGPPGLGVPSSGLNPVAAPQAANAIHPLIGVIRRSTRSKGGR